MLKGLTSRLRNVARHAASLPLNLLDARLRAEAIEALSMTAVTTVEVPGGALHFWTPTALLLDRAKALLTKEPEMIPWLDGLAQDSVLWDIGANVGVFSLYAAKVRKCTVLAFEPSAANFHALTRNIELNDASTRVTSYCVALAGRSGTGQLNLWSPLMGSAVSHFGERGERSRYWQGHDGAASHGMVGFTVDDFLEQFDPPFPTHLKLDVDGLEWPILQGATRTLRDPRLRSAMVEITLTHDEERTDAIRLLEGAGLKLVAQGIAQGTGGEQAANHLFERSAI